MAYVYNFGYGSVLPARLLQTRNRKISEALTLNDGQLPPSADDVPAENRLDWYDAEDGGSVCQKEYEIDSDLKLKVQNAVVGWLPISSSVGGGSSPFYLRAPAVDLAVEMTIWPANCGTQVKNATTRLNGVEVVGTATGFTARHGDRP